MNYFFEIPKYCPSCNSQTFEVGSFLICKNTSCVSKSSGTVKVWIEKLGIMNWGDSIIESLTGGNNPKVVYIYDLYNLSIEDIALHCSGLKHAKKCYDCLHSQKTVKLELVLSSINIPNLGISTATDIVNSGFDTIEKVLSITLDQLVNIPNIGEKTANSIFNGIQEKSDTLIGLNSVLTIKGFNDGSLRSKSFCITGATKIPRKALQKMILDNGGTVKESVVSGLTFLVTNEDPNTFASDKIKKAKKYNVNLLTEDQLIKLIGT